MPFTRVNRLATLGIKVFFPTAADGDVTAKRTLKAAVPIRCSRPKQVRPEGSATEDFT